MIKVYNIYFLKYNPNTWPTFSNGGSSIQHA